MTIMKRIKDPVNQGTILFAKNGQIYGMNRNAIQKFRISPQFIIKDDKNSSQKLNN